MADRYVFHIMSLSGHDTLEYMPAGVVGADDPEVQAAMAKFNELVTTGYRAATRKAGEREYTVIKQFTQQQDETLFVPHMQGG